MNTAARKFHWSDDRKELAAFGRWLDRNDDGDINPWDLVESPQKWDDEHDRWVAAGRPDWMGKPTDEPSFGEGDVPEHIAVAWARAR